MTHSQDCHNDVENGPPKAQSDRNDGVPMPIYSTVWSFLLDSSSPRFVSPDHCFIDFKSIASCSFLDFKSIASFMHVNMTSKKAFDACRGWFFCAEALRRELEAKLLLIRPYKARGFQLVQQLHDVNTPAEFGLWRQDLDSWIDEMDRMLVVESRIILIQSSLLRKANHLVVSYGGDEFSVDPYESTLVDILATAMLESSLQMLEAL